MTTKKRPIYPDERLAFREAGHAIVAHHFRIPFDQFGLNFSLAPRAMSIYTSLEKYCELTPDQPADSRKLDHYIMFLLAGTVADMVHSEHHWKIRPRTPQQRQFRSRWYTESWDVPDAKVDLAYLAISMWLPATAPFCVDKDRKRFWKATVELLEQPRIWRAMKHVAKRIEDREMIIDSDVDEILSETSEEQ